MSKTIRASVAPDEGSRISTSTACSVTGWTSRRILSPPPPNRDPPARPRVIPGLRPICPSFGCPRDTIRRRCGQCKNGVEDSQCTPIESTCKFVRDSSRLEPDRSLSQPRQRDAHAGQRLDAGTRGMSKPTHIHSKVRGVSRHQRTAGRCRRGSELRIVREPANLHDSCAIRFDAEIGWIFRRWSQVGYMSMDLAQRFAPLIDRGLELRVFVNEVTGGGLFRSHGVNITLRFDKRERDRILRDMRAADRAEWSAQASASFAGRQREKAAKPARKRRRRAVAGYAVTGARRSLSGIGAGVRRGVRRLADARQYAKDNQDSVLGGLFTFGPHSDDSKGDHR